MACEAARCRQAVLPLLRPTQAMSIDGNKNVLPMGRGHKSIVLDRPEWLTEKTACKLVWNRMGYELHVSMPAKATEPVVSDVHAAIDLGRIHQCAVTTNTGQGLIDRIRSWHPVRSPSALADGRITTATAVLRCHQDADPNPPHGGFLLCASHRAVLWSARGGACAARGVHPSCCRGSTWQPQKRVR